MSIFPPERLQQVYISSRTFEWWACESSSSNFENSRVSVTRLSYASWHMTASVQSSPTWTCQVQPHSTWSTSEIHMSENNLIKIRLSSNCRVISPVGMDWSGQKNSTLPGQTLVVLSTHSHSLVVILTKMCSPSAQLWTNLNSLSGKLLG